MFNNNFFVKKIAIIKLKENSVRILIKIQSFSIKSWIGLLYNLPKPYFVLSRVVLPNINTGKIAT